MEQKPRRPGRPGKKGGRNFYEGDLHALLVDRLPEKFVNVGRLDVRALSEATGYARFTIYQWLLKDRITVGAAKALMKVEPVESTLTTVDLLPFVLS